MEWNGVKVLVTGSAGFIGTHLCNKLAAEGAEVVGTRRPKRSTSNSSGRYKVVPLDLCKADDIEPVLSEYKPDVVYHLAGTVSSAQNPELTLPMFHDNLEATVYLLESLAEYGRARVVTVSTIEESFTGGIPQSPYGVAKQAARLYTDFFRLQRNLPLVQLRLHVAFGPGQQELKFIPYVINSYLDGEAPVLRTPTRSCDFIYIEDVISALLLAVGEDPSDGRVRDVGSGTSNSLVHVAAWIKSLLTTTQPEDSLHIPDRRATSLSFNSPANIEYSWDWQPTVPLEEGLKRTIEWCKVQRANRRLREPIYP